MKLKSIFLKGQDTGIVTKLSLKEITRRINEEDFLEDFQESLNEWWSCKAVVRKNETERNSFIDISGDEDRVQIKLNSLIILD